MLQAWYSKLPRDGFGKIRWGHYLYRIARRVALWFLGISIGLTLVYAVLPVPLTPLMIQRSFEQANGGKGGVRWKHDWVSGIQISDRLKLAVVCGEDQHFLDHCGLDFDAINKAIRHNARSKRTLGASTISQQTAKNIFLWPSRSWLRKGFELYFTGLIELLWSKRRIMTVYLNSIEFGRGVYGAEAAARHFYRKSARELSWEQAAMLAAVLPNPHRYRADQPNSRVLSRQRRIMGQMRLWGYKLDFDKPNTPKGTE